MSKQAKLLLKLNQSKNTFKWTELTSLLANLGYAKVEMAGSRVRFTHNSHEMILLHKPHPENEIKGGALKAVKLHLKQQGLLCIMNYLKYKGYLGTIQPDLENKNLFGKLAFISDLVTYEATTITELEQEFKNSIDIYLQSCQEANKEPCKPLKGSFNIRISPELHQQAVEASGDNSLNVFVAQAISEKVARA